MTDAHAAVQLSHAMNTKRSLYALHARDTEGLVLSPEAVLRGLSSLLQGMDTPEGVALPVPGGGAAASSTLQSMLLTKDID